MYRFWECLAVAKAWKWGAFIQASFVPMIRENAEQAMIEELAAPRLNAQLLEVATTTTPTRATLRAHDVCYAQPTPRVGAALRKVTQLSAGRLHLQLRAESRLHEVNMAHSDPPVHGTTSHVVAPFDMNITSEHQMVRILEVDNMLVRLICNLTP